MIGDIVHLKSGGPGLTIISVDERSGKTAVAWFVGDDLHTAIYPAICLS